MTKPKAKTPQQITAMAKKLADHTRKLEKQEEFLRRKATPWKCMSCILIDGILQAGMRYPTVLGRVKKFVQEYPSVETVGQFKRLIAKKPVAKVIDWKSGRKTEALKCLVALLAKDGVETVGDFHKWTDKDANIVKLKAINGIKNKTADYLKKLAGHKDVAAVDTRIWNFLCEAGIVGFSYSDTRTIVSQAAALLKMMVTDYDTSIWLYMEGKKKGKK